MDLMQGQWGASVLSTRPAPWYLFFGPFSLGRGFSYCFQLLALLFSVLNPWWFRVLFFWLLRWDFSAFFDVRLLIGRVVPFVQCKLIGKTSLGAQMY